MSFTIRSSAEWKEVRHKIDLVQVARALFGEPEEKSGDTYYWFCPFHSGTEPCFQITGGNCRWKCSGCGQWGDAVDLVRRGKEVTFSQALEFLSRQEFYLIEEDVRTEPLVFDGQVISGESTGDNDHWIDDLLNSESVSE
jgi:DNA primase